MGNEWEHSPRTNNDKKLPPNNLSTPSIVVDVVVVVVDVVNDVAFCWPIVSWNWWIGAVFSGESPSTSNGHFNFNISGQWLKRSGTSTIHPTNQKAVGLNGSLSWSFVAFFSLSFSAFLNKNVDCPKLGPSRRRISFPTLGPNWLMKPRMRMRIFFKL